MIIIKGFDTIAEIKPLFHSKISSEQQSGIKSGLMIGYWYSKYDWQYMCVCDLIWR